MLENEVKSDTKDDLSAKSSDIDLENPSLYINREISWLRFNYRVLEEAKDQSHPLLERLKFLAICGSNLDEFFMVRVPGLKRQLEKGALEAPPDGLSPQQQIDSIQSEVQFLISSYSDVWYKEFLPQLEKEGIKFSRVTDLKAKQRKDLRKWFEKNVFPILTPLTFDVCHPFPIISGMAVNLAALVQDSRGREKFARVKIPGLYPRFTNLRDLNMADDDSDQYEFLFLEDLVASNLDMLFPGMKVLAAYPFRVTRDAQIEIELDEAADLMTAMEEKVQSRRTACSVRLEVDQTMPDEIVDLLGKKLGIPTPKLIYRSQAPLALVDLWQLHGINRPDLKDTPFIPYTPGAFSNEGSALASACGREAILYHPYDSFQPIVDLVQEAAEDPDVLAIKITLYRIDRDSPIVQALMDARHNHKAVAAVVELKAKFDEMSNIAWARQMEQAGVHVVYGLEELKVHAKLLLIVKKSRGGITRICHISTGNYNAQTARIYADLGYMTCDKDIADDVSDLFNTLTGFSEKSDYRKLLISPKSLRQGIVSRIEREIEQHSKTNEGYMAFKLNALIDKEIIQALYRASMAGIKIDLNVRGLCSLRPGVAGVSENIRVTSIVGRFLEHCRIYYFHNGGNEELLIGSSDLMPRNLKRRVEVLVPIQNEDLRKAILEDILMIHLKDNVKARVLKSDGTYERVKPRPGEPELNSQEWLIQHRGEWHRES